MRIGCSIILATILTLTGMQRSAEAYAESPTQLLKRTNSTLASLLRKKADRTQKARLHKTISAFLDFRELSRRALGKHWDARSEAERGEFVSVLKQLIEKSYTKQLRSNIDYKVEYRGEQVRGEVATVSTVVRVVKDGRPEEVSIQYKMRRVGPAWMVFDVVTDDVSIVSNYRSQFNKIIRQHNFAHLLKKMKRKLETI